MFINSKEISDLKSKGFTILVIHVQHFQNMSIPFFCIILITNIN